MDVAHLAIVALIVLCALVAILLAPFPGRRRFSDAASGAVEATPTQRSAPEKTPVEQGLRVAISAEGGTQPSEAVPASTPDAHEATFLRELEAAEYYEEPREPIVRAYTDYIVTRVRREVDAGSDLRRCQAVDGGGDRCPRPAATTIRYVGKPGLPAADVTLCTAHAIAGVLHPGANR